MIDTIRLYKYFTNKVESEETDKFLQDNFVTKIKNEEFSDNSKPPKKTIQCNLGNLQINKSFNKIFIEGSLWKYFKGDNMGSFKNHEIITAYDKLKFNIPTINWKEVKFSRMHYGPNLKVSHSPDLYLNLIGSCKNKKRTEIIDKSITVTVGSDSNQLSFYNKSVESNIQSNDNIIRIEHKTNSAYWRQKHFGDEYPLFETLLFHLDKLPEIWHTYYKSVSKDYNPIILAIESFSKLNLVTFQNYGYQNCENIINRSYTLGTMKKPQYSYSKRMISEIQRKGKEFAETVSPIVELDMKVEEFILNCKTT